MRISPVTTKNNQNFTKTIKNQGKVEIDKGKATAISTNQPYSGTINAKNANGNAYLYYNNGLLYESIYYKPAGFVYGEKISEKVVKKYKRNADNTQINITTNHYNPWATKKPEVHTRQELYPNGKLKRKETKFDGQTDIKTFFPTGKMESSIHSHQNGESYGLTFAYFYDKKGNLIKKILPYRDETGRKVVQNEYRNGKITKSTKAYFTTAKNPITKMPVDTIGQLIPIEVVEFNKKGEITKKYSV